MKKGKIKSVCWKVLFLFFSGKRFFSSCAPEEKGGWIKNGTKTTRKEIFRKLKDYSLALIIMTPQRTYIPETEKLQSCSYYHEQKTHLSAGKQ